MNDGLSGNVVAIDDKGMVIARVKVGQDGIKTLGVAPDYRGQGLSDEILRTAESLGVRVDKITDPMVTEGGAKSIYRYLSGKPPEVPGFKEGRVRPGEATDLPWVEGASPDDIGLPRAETADPEVLAARDAARADEGVNTGYYDVSAVTADEEAGRTGGR